MNFGRNQKNEKVANDCSNDVHEEGDREIRAEDTENSRDEHEANVEVPKIGFSDLPYKKLDETSSSYFEHARHEEDPADKIADSHEEDGPIRDVTVDEGVLAVFA